METLCVNLRQPLRSQCYSDKSHSTEDRGITVAVNESVEGELISGVKFFFPIHNLFLSLMKVFECRVTVAVRQVLAYIIA